MTTLSFVHVRFEYACGHAALVSLPRLKAEPPVQRTARVNYEKAAAGQRSCDFCPVSTQPIVGANDLNGVGSVAAVPPATHTMNDEIDHATVGHTVTGDHVHELKHEEAMTMTTAETVSEPAPAHDHAPATPETTPALIRSKGMFPLRKLTDEQEREVTRLYAESLTSLVEIGQRFGIGQTSVARIAQRHGAQLRSPTISRAMASDRPGPTSSTDRGPAIESQTKPAQPRPAAQPVVPPAARAPKSATTSRRRIA